MRDKTWAEHTRSGGGGRGGGGGGALWPSEPCFLCLSRSGRGRPTMSAAGESVEGGVRSEVGTSRRLCSLRKGLGALHGLCIPSMSHSLRYLGASGLGGFRAAFRHCRSLSRSRLLRLGFRPCREAPGTIRGLQIKANSASKGFWRCCGRKGHLQSAERLHGVRILKPEHRLRNLGRQQHLALLV